MNFRLLFRDKLFRTVLNFSKIFLTLIILGVIANQNRESFYLIRFSDLRLFWLFPTFLNSLILIQLVAAYRWQQFIISTGGKYSLLSLLRINLVSIFYGLLLPSSDGFAVFRILLLESESKELHAKASASVILEKLTGFLTLTLMVSIAGLFLFRGILIYAVLLFLIVILLFIFMWIRRNGGDSVIGNSKGRIRFFLSKVLGYLQKSDKKLLVTRALPLVVIVQFLSFINVYFVFRLFGITTDFFQHIILQPVIQLISLIPLTVSGLGIRESAFIHFYSKMGIAGSTLMFVSLINFVTLSVVPAIIGGLINLFSGTKVILESSDRLVR
ncbi:MAG: lysylphosphatidylglycerol synthase transmembrane domain-containing protein [Candidatus Cloacimonetes bacterium]|nr:lysylphosphatidylglycerol synthase transmembrane domain-containing protein [Candidatus Cloacimonadota bacterium]